MAKGNYRYRNLKDNQPISEIVNDFCTVCKNHTISKQAVYDMARSVSWELTEYNGKYKGCKFWTANALSVYNESNSKSESVLKKELIHEHVIPRKFLIDYIMDCYKNSREPERKYFDFMFACVVRKDENNTLDSNYKSSMPGNIKEIDKIENPWARYIESGIKDIYKVEWDNSKKTIKKITEFNIIKS